MPEIARCDFCGSDAPRWRYAAEDYTALVNETTVVTSLGDWAACTPCHQLIEAGDRLGLACRTLANHPDWGSSNTIIERIMEIHARFFSHKRPERGYSIIN